jgi:hypothetical protein
MKGDHKFDTEHAEYNRRVSKATEKYLAGPPPIDPSTMRTEDARKLYDTVVTRNPEVQDHINKMIESNRRFKTLYPAWKE